MPRLRLNIESEAVYDKRVGIIRIIVHNKEATSIFLETVKVYYTRPLMIAIVVMVLLSIVVVIGVTYHTEDIVGVVNTLLTMGAIVVGVLGKKIGQKTVEKHVRALLASNETFTITIPSKKKPNSIELYTNKGIVKPRLRELIARPKPKPIGKTKR